MSADSQVTFVKGALGTTHRAGEFSSLKMRIGICHWEAAQCWAWRCRGQTVGCGDALTKRQRWFAEVQIGVQLERPCFCSDHLRASKVLTQVSCPILKLSFKNYAEALERSQSRSVRKRGHPWYAACMERTGYPRKEETEQRLAMFF